MRRFALELSLILLASAACAQTVTGALDGHVTDAAGGMVSNAQVVAHDPATGVERSTVTNETGYFSMPFVPVGTYDLEVSAKGFATLEANNTPSRWT